MLTNRGATFAVINAVPRSKENQVATVAVLLGRYGQTYADEIGIRIEKNTPAPLFQLLCSALLLGSRIRSQNAVEASRALFAAGLTTPRKMAQASWQERVDVLTSQGYKRYDESASRMLGDSANLVIDEYKGDLRRLREAAEYDREREKTLLQAFPGIGDVSADIFLREIQATWHEVFPYADARVRAAARRLGLTDSPSALASLTSHKDFPRLAAALIRIDLGAGYEEIQEKFQAAV
jgi:endonuclease III